MRRLIIAVAALFWLAGPAAAAPLAAYGRLPAVSDIALSPDGKLIATSTVIGGRGAVLVRRADDDERVFAGALSPASSSAGEDKMRGITWVDPTHLVVFMSRTALTPGLTVTRYEFLSASLIDVSSGEVTSPISNTSRTNTVLLRMLGVRLVDGSPNIFLVVQTRTEWRGFMGEFELALYRYDLRSKRSVLVEKAGETIRGWTIGPDGQTLGRSLYEDHSGRWTLQVRDAAGRWKTAIEETLPLGPPSLRGLGRDGKTVVTEAPGASGQDDGEPVLREYGPEGTADLPALTSMIYDPVTHRLIGGRERHGDDGDYMFFDAKDLTAWRAIVRGYPNQRVQLASWSDDRSKVIVEVDDSSRAPAYSLVDLTTRKARWIDEVYPELGDADVSPVRAYRYKAQDGLEISGYLTLPKGRSPKDLPLVVLPHGGPASRDYPGFDWWSQALASRGYAVLRPNFRGSGGLGEGFKSAGYGEWGRKMQSDLSDGVKALATEGVIDPKRVCIVGASYGGYAALAGVTLQQGVYRCAVSVAGPSDLGEMLRNESEEGSGRVTQRYWTNFMGATAYTDKKLDTLSPARLAAKAEAPILLIHGRDDTVVPYSQSHVMAEALARAGKRHELVALDGEDHWLSLGRTRLKMLEASVAFLERENPPN